jgi:hypothetical protein
VLVELALLEKALVRVPTPTTSAHDSGMFLEIQNGQLRVVGQGWEELVPLRSWAPDQVYGAYYTPTRLHKHSPRNPGTHHPLKQLSDGTLICGHWVCRPASRGEFWSTRHG